MSLPYSTLGNFTGSIKSGSFLNEQDTKLFYVSQSSDIWFGFSPNDVIEISTFDTNDDTLTNWSVLEQNKEYKTVTLSYIDSLNNVKTYSYNELVRGFTQYKNNKILLNPINDLSSMGITEGNLKLSYVFTRHMAGTPLNPLSIKEISPSRTEIKLVPHGNTDLSYTAFALKKFTVRDIAPVLLSIIQKFPYDEIYRKMYSTYTEEINVLKSMFFLNDDGSVLLFLKNLYEDYVKYTGLSEEQILNGLEPTRILRIQGIRTYFNNYLLQNYDIITDFESLENKMSEFINLRLDERFIQYKSSDANYQQARSFVYDFFFKYFYQDFVNPLRDSHGIKYYGYLKNVLNFGNNQYFSILNHDYLDERNNPNDPLTLVVKLSSELPSDFVQKSTCWVSNVSMVPYVLTARLQNPIKYKTIKISAPDFGNTNQFITKENINKMYSSDDLEISENTQNDITINKNLVELNTDYTDYQNFIVFSSAVTRHNIFKNKMISWTVLSASMSSLDNLYTESLSSSITYPYYTQERESINSQIAELVNSFDGYESYLFNSGNYEYLVHSSSFVDSDYVETQDEIALQYDRNNRDSLISNTPEYIINDSNNEEYLTFLTMTGHHFDNIYTYISALPIERQVKNELSSSIPTNTLKEMLYSFGWNVDDIIGNLNVDEVYLNSLNSSSYNVISAEERLQTIWNRILMTLPGIYKTKGTEECVRYLMSCYGLPSSLINIREYGGVDSSDDSMPTYRLDEKTYMLKFSGSGDYIEGPMPSDVQTVEFKFAVESGSYQNYVYTPMFVSVPYPYNTFESSSWSIGVSKTPGKFMGRIHFQMRSGSTGAELTSSILPLFNGSIYSVMLRRNNPNSNFQYSTSSNAYPTIYDLTIQRNEDGRKLFYSTSSFVMDLVDNTIFNQYGRFRLSNGTFVGNLDKLSIWGIPIGDSDFEEHVNDLNSYGYSGSNAYKNLLVRLSLEYPKSLYYNLSGSSAVWVNNESPYYSIPNYYSDTNNLSSSIDSTLYSASVDIIEDRWLSYIPTGSIEIIGYNFPPVIGSNWTASFNTSSCSWESSSVYPFHYTELTYQQDIDASKYGPNKYKNRKIRKYDYTVEARFDSDDRSTNDNTTISGETNQLGFFIDPQDSKNKNIIRYIGKSGIMKFIGEPSNLYEDRYYDLRNKNYEYHSAGNKQTYFNELITVYKFYFDKSIFQAIKNILPARANSFTGIVIEPTILERPKYQNRIITSSVSVTYREPGVINDIYSISDQLLWADFNTNWYLFTSASQAVITSSLPPSYQDTIDLTYINEPIRQYPNNLNRGYVMDEMDFIQRCVYGDYENQIRGWEPRIECRNWIYGSVSRDKTHDLPSIDYHHVPVGIDETGNSSAVKHQNLYYMLKVWEQYFYYAKTGEYVRTNNISENKHDSASVYLYKYVMVDERFMNQNVHFFNEITTSIVPEDPSFSVINISGSNYYVHKSNTFKNTPDQTFSNVSSSFVSGNPFINPFSFDVVLAPDTKYFELINGYPRNHFNHKSKQFSNTKYAQFINDSYNTIYVKGRNTIDGTINEDGIDDGTYPVQSFNVSNVSIKNSSNVIQSVVSTDAGAVAPPGTNSPISAVQSTGSVLRTDRRLYYSAVSGIARTLPSSNTSSLFGGTRR